MPTRGLRQQSRTKPEDGVVIAAFRAERNADAKQVSVDDGLRVVVVHSVRLASSRAVIEGRWHVVDPACVLADAQREVVLPGRVRLRTERSQLLHQGPTECTDSSEIVLVEESFG